MLCRPITSILLVVLGCGVASATRDWGSWKDWTSSTSAFNLTNNSTGPSFCHGYLCPSFTTEGNSTVYEIRTYPASKCPGQVLMLRALWPVLYAQQVFRCLNSCARMYAILKSKTALNH